MLVLDLEGRWMQYDEMNKHQNFSFMAGVVVGPVNRIVHEYCLVLKVPVAEKK
jgi:hypothetical protein